MGMRPRTAQPCAGLGPPPAQALCFTVTDGSSRLPHAGWHGQAYTLCSVFPARLGLTGPDQHVLCSLMPTPSLSPLIEQTRSAITQLQEALAALERAQALLGAAAPPPPARPTTKAAPSPRPTGGLPTRTRILDLLRNSHTPLAPAALRRQLAAQGHGVHRSTLTHVLRTLRKSRLVECPSPGVYRLATSAPAAPARLTQPAAAPASAKPASRVTPPRPSARHAPTRRRR